MLVIVLTYLINHKGKQEGFEEQTPPEFRCLFSLCALHSQYAYRKPHGGFVVFPLFMFYVPNTYIVNPHGGFVVYPLFMLCILNTHIVNRMAVSLFIGQGWRATSTLSPSNEQETNAKGVAFSSDKWLS